MGAPRPICPRTVALVAPLVRDTKGGLRETSRRIVTLSDFGLFETGMMTRSSQKTRSPKNSTASLVRS